MSRDDGAKVLHLKPHATTHTKTDTIEVSPELLTKWKAPPFQRPLRVNARVLELVAEIKRDGGVIPGVITLGHLGRDTYLLDGQHRMHAFLLSELPLGYVDIRVHYLQDMAEMGKEFVRLNSRLVNLRPDDVLRGLEEGNEALRYVRTRCPFVGYDQIRRSERSPIVSMSTLLRCWFGSHPETPTSGGGGSSTHLAETLTVDDAENLATILLVLEKSWGRHQEYARLWGALNLTLCFWLWRRTVTTQYSPSSVRLTKEAFSKCMMSVSAATDYVDWLGGRNLSERDRSPAYSKLKAIIAHRMEADTSKRPRLPQPEWAKGH